MFFSFQALFGNIPLESLDLDSSMFDARLFYDTNFPGEEIPVSPDYMEPFLFDSLPPVQFPPTRKIMTSPSISVEEGTPVSDISSVSELFDQPHSFRQSGDIYFTSPQRFELSVPEVINIFTS